MYLNVLLTVNSKCVGASFLSHGLVKLPAVWADPFTARAGICLKSGAAMTSFHRHQAEGAIKQPVSAVTEAVGNHCQQQVPVGQSRKPRGQTDCSGD